MPAERAAKDKRPAENGRQARLKAALKANIARRKAQARARADKAAGQDKTEQD